MNARYALYLAPPPDSPLGRFGARVVGRDAATGRDLSGFAPQGYTPDAWREIAAEPRRYGFHATLKAPLRLKDGLPVGAFETRIAALASEFTPFNLGALRVSVLKSADSEIGFVALTAARSAALAALEARALEGLDEFRAPPSEAEIARRRPERLSPRQRDYLAAYGYPYVLEEFRLHFTLSGAVREPEALAEKLRDDFEQEVADPSFVVDALVLFEQKDGGDFLVRSRYPLAAPED
jgi:Protein of unknown function (DUF1045)